MTTVIEKISNFLDNILEFLNLSQNAIENVVVENRDYINAEMNVVKKSEKGIDALKEFAKTEEPSLSDALSTLAETYEALENARREKVEKLNLQFIKPLEDLLVSFKTKERELDEAGKAEKKLDKVKRKLEKENAKPEDKKDPVGLNVLKKKHEDALKDYEREENQAKIAIDAFKKEKMETIKKILVDIVEIQKDFHQKMINKIENLEQKTTAINVGDVVSSPENLGSLTEDKDQINK